jgi:hypothetical protein
LILDLDQPHGMRQQNGPGWCQPDLSCASFEQLKPELVLQSLDPLSEGRLGDV